MTPGTPARPGLMVLLSVACGLLAANVYYAQPLAGTIASDLHLSERAAGLVVTLTQIGYGLGLLLVVPLADRLENRALILGLVTLAGGALCLAALTQTAAVFFVASLAIGLGSVCVQVLVPYATHLASSARSGRTVGTVTTGLMVGIMLARPVSGFVAASLGWRAMFWISAALMGALLATLFHRLPARRPPAQDASTAMLPAMARALASMPLLRQRILYQMALFSGFSLFWTTIPLWLAGPAWGWSHAQIGLFALAGAMSAVVAPIAGTLADHGHARAGTAGALAAGTLAFVLAGIAPAGTGTGTVVLVLSALLLDLAVTMSFVIGQRTIFGLASGGRARLNGVYMASFTAAGALGSAVGTWIYAAHGWGVVAAAGAVMVVLAGVRFSFARADASSRAAPK
ncbi:putative nitrate/nitrite transporter NarK2 [Aquimixticola soesokkakensis]|uniref:Putative nitrate/nitrite transporter NarK2 n=1 Tax=Aquimixticola soesokkakensis TaxID=1519096 RepID=A0A1Y5TMY5_9RHOB|nr:MFS transporter [Aquimixticola soesokkakensis]SLN63923.1 putative nitrate/nitrite transporter NarK2 [Aquimixticola soesokkakensis]